MLPGTYLADPKIESEWFEIVDAALGASYKDVARNLWYVVSEKKRQTSQDEQEKHKFYQELLWGFDRGDVPYEFIAYLAQHHLYGKDWIFQRYGEFFSPAQMDKLYAFSTN